MFTQIPPATTAILVATVLAAGAQAQDQLVAGNLTVEGAADIEGNTLAMGTTPNDQPALTLSYLPPEGSGQPHLINFAATSPAPPVPIPKTPGWTACAISSTFSPSRSNSAPPLRA